MDAFFFQFCIIIHVDISDIVSPFRMVKSYGVECHFQLYFKYIVELIFIGGEITPSVDHWQTLTLNVVSGTHHSQAGFEFTTWVVSDMHWLHR